MGDAAQPVRHRGMITVSIMLATIMQALDTTIANVALPHMQGSLSAAQDQISWVLTSYIVAAAVATPLTGWVSNRIGRKKLFLVSVAGFTVASLLCGIATSIEEMVLFRLMQGLFGAGLVPLSQAVLLDINPPEHHGSAMAIWGAGIMVGPIFGPTLGGYLTELYNWRWVFLINLPVGLIAFAGILTFVTETKTTGKRHFDLFGFAMLALAIGALQLMLDRGELKDWFSSGEIIVEAAVAGLAFYLFLAHSLTTSRPFLEMELFRDRNFAIGLVFIFIVGIILLATMALLPPMLQNLMDYPVITTGLVLAPRGVGTMIAMLVVGRLVNRVDARLLIFVGLALTAASLYEMTGFSLEIATSDLVRTGITQGLGLGFIFVPLSTLTFATLHARFRTDATALYSLVRNLGSSVGISIVVALLSQNSQISHAELASTVTPYNKVFHLPGVPSFWNLANPAGLAAFDAEVNRQAAMIAYLNDFKLMMVVTLLAVPLLLLVRVKRRAPGTAAPEPIAAE
jgi:MFS transporter, DHA2 family, multidrug resistance protein